MATDAPLPPELAPFNRPAIDWAKAEKKVICSTMVCYGSADGPTGTYAYWASGECHPEKIIDPETGRRDMPMLYQPMIGPYDQKDPKTIEYQMDMADRMGIDAWAVWYWPPLDRESEVHRENMKLYMDCVEANDRRVRICGVIDVAFYPVAVEIGALETWGPDDVVRQIEDYLDTFADRPSYFCYEGRPVVFIFSPLEPEFSAAQWDYVLRKVRHDGYDPLFFVEVGLDWYDHLMLGKSFPDAPKGDTETGAYVSHYRELMDLFDGVFNMSHIGFGHLAGIDRFEAWRHGVEVGREKNCNFMPNPAAGYQTYLWVKPPDPVFEVPRRDGAHYAECWDDAVRAGARWIFLHTWNEWYEHTQLEPALDYKYLYVDLTREWGDRFRANADTA